MISPAPAPWRPAGHGVFRTGGLLGVGFAAHPETGRELLLVGSHNGTGLFDTGTGERLARDDSSGWPDDDLTSAGIGPIAGVRVPMAGLSGGSLPTSAPGGWSVRITPDDRMELSAGDTWTIARVHATELRAVGFSPSGNTLIAATTSTVSLWTRSEPGEQ